MGAGDYKRPPEGKVMAAFARMCFGNPNLTLYWFDLTLVGVIYVLSVILFMRRKRGFITPLLVFGLFLFPLQFGIWFLASKVGIVFFPNLHFFEIFYLLFLKICLILTILSPRA